MATIQTLSDLLFHLRDVSAGSPELVSVSTGGRLESWSAADFVRSVHALALALEAEGLRRGERVAIYSENRPEWQIVDFACHLLGAPTVPVHPDLPSEQVAFVLRNSGSRWVFFGHQRRRDVLAELRGGLASMPRAIAFDGDATFDGEPSITRLLGVGAERQGQVPVERFRGRVAAEDLASLLYTSGTTGDPKGVMLSHRNLVSNVLALARVFDLGPRDRSVSFLPLSHVFQRTVDYLCFYRGVPIVYVPGADDVPKALRRVRPTVMAAAPAVYEGAYRRTLRRVESMSPGRRRLFRWAVDVGKRHATAGREGIIGPVLALQRYIARRLVYRSVQERFGGRLRLAVSGGAPLPQEVGEFFEAVGIPLYQGYGLTETSPVLTTNDPDHHRPGSVGRALSDVELRIAEDGEILVRGPGVMQGYWQDPKATAESVDDSGWFRTGDVGRMDKSGYVFITDRKRDLIVTSGGENIAPRPIEVLLTGGSLVRQAVVVGDGRPYLGALLVPDLPALRSVVGADLEPRELVSHPEVRRRIEEHVGMVNGRLAEPSRIRAWRLLDRPLSVEEGELTPTLGVRRRVVARRYAQQIADLYDA